jgi:acyl carrier protein
MEHGKEGPALKEFLSQTLPDYMIPSYFVQVDSIPLNPSGKIDRKALPGPDPAIAAGDGYTAPQGETETRLAVLWSEVLDIGKKHIGRDTGFFRIGGHSLKAAALISKIHQEFNAAVSMMEVFDFPKLKDLAACIKKAGAAGYSYIRPAEERDYYSLSSAQKRLYIIQQGDPRDTTYHITTIGILEGIPDKTKMENAFRRLIERHESLRTSFHIFGKEPVQRIHKRKNSKLQITNYKAPAGHPARVPNSNFQITEMIQNFVCPFDLARAPLLRVGLIKKAEEKYILAADMHHIISDAISLQVLVEEFMRLYRGETLPSLRLQYKDFSQWQNNLVLSGHMKKQEDYWLNRFKGKLPVLKIPTDYPRPLDRSFAGSHTEFEVSAAAAAKLRHLANEENASLFMVILALNNVLLFKLSGQEDIIVATAAAGRTHADLEHIIGVFVNTLALRNNPSGDTSFIQFLKKVRQRTLEAFDNQEYQFQDLVDLVLKERDPNRNPLFDVMVNFNAQDTAPAQETAITNPADTDRPLEFKPYTGYEYRESRFDLLISGSDTGDRFQFTVEYSTRLFKEETIQRFGHYFREIIAAVVEDETVRLKDIPLSIDLASAEAGTFRDDDGDFAF